MSCWDCWIKTELFRFLFQAESSRKEGVVLTSAAAAEEAAPPPAVVLHGQLEVGEGHGDEGGHDEQDDEDYAEDAIDGVHLWECAQLEPG